MKNEVKKFIFFKGGHYQKELENKLEAMAKKGLFLKKTGSLFWTFTKEEPKDIKYTVTYFSEASMFNPCPTDNQQTYLDYALESGWIFVDELNQMQIFCNENENPISLETDAQEQFETIKKCMNKSYVIPYLLLLMIFSCNLLLQYQSFERDPIYFFSDIMHFYATLVQLSGFLCMVYILISYFFGANRVKNL